MLQSDEPKIHIMLQMIRSFVSKLLGRFMKAEVLTNEDLTDINVDDEEKFLLVE